MKDQKYFLNTALTAIYCGILLVCVLLRAFAPVIILPKLDVPAVVLVSLLSLLVEHYLAGNSSRNYLVVAVFGMLCFGVLTFVARFATPLGILGYGIPGGLIFTLVTWLFDSMMDRLSSGPAARFAPILSALGLYLASQCFAGIV